MKAFGLLSTMLLAGCGGGEAMHWINAENRIVSVENIPSKSSSVQRRRRMVAWD